MVNDSNKLSAWRKSFADLINRRLWQVPAATSPLVMRFLLRTAQILFAIGRDLREGQLNLRAMSLVYSTILGFVPMVALTFAALKSLGVHNAMEPALMTLLESLGDRREEVIAQILEFVDNINVEVIGISSLGLLIYLVLDMMRKIETSFNYIWSVSRGRSWSSRVSEYLFAVIVSPLLIFISISITSSVNSLLFARFIENLSFAGSLLSLFGFVLPLLLMSLAFAFAYSFLPNTRVKFSSALLGGVVTTLIWKLMGAFFQGFFISAARESIYLAFATVIAVMIFTYLGWLVALLGSDIAYYHQYPARCRNGRHSQHLSISRQETITLVLAALIIRRFQAGRPPLTADQLAARLGVNPASIDDNLAALIEAGLITTTADDPAMYVPLSAVAHTRMTDLWRRLRERGNGPLPEFIKLPEGQLVEQFMHHLYQVTDRELGAMTFIDEGQPGP